MDARIRDALVLAGVFALLLGGLYLFTGTWPPAVIVESASMMHASDEVAFGRIGTIDPGDLVLVKDVASVDDVATLVEGGPTHYGKPGDVIVYFAASDHTRTPIIHRAIAYVVISGLADGTTYRVRWDASAPCVGGAAKDPRDARWCVYGSDGIRIPSVPLGQNGGYKPDRTGFVTKGDNPASNPAIDQLARIAPGTVQLSWIEGKARGEVPWVGLLKLALASDYNEADCKSGLSGFLFFRTIEVPSCRGWLGIGHALAPKDLWVMLAVSVGVLVGVPIAWDVVAKRMRRAKSAE